MASFRESIDALKEAGLADLEILEIMSDSVDGKMNTKTLLTTINPDMNLQKLIKMLMLRHPRSVKGRPVPSAQRNNPNHLGKAPQS